MSRVRCAVVLACRDIYEEITEKVSRVPLSLERYSASAVRGIKFKNLL